MRTRGNHVICRNLLKGFQGKHMLYQTGEQQIDISVNWFSVQAAPHSGIGVDAAEARSRSERKASGRWPEAIIEVDSEQWKRRNARNDVMLRLACRMAPDIEKVLVFSSCPCSIRVLSKYYYLYIYIIAFR